MTHFFFFFFFFFGASASPFGSSPVLVAVVVVVVAPDGMALVGTSVAPLVRWRLRRRAEESSEKSAESSSAWNRRGEMGVPPFAVTSLGDPEEGQESEPSVKPLLEWMELKSKSADPSALLVRVRSSQSYGVSLSPPDVL